MYVLYSYSGWNAAAYIVGEVKNPQKTVPRALLAATGFVTVLYVLLNAVFLRERSPRRLCGEDGSRRDRGYACARCRGRRILSILISAWAVLDDQRDDVGRAARGADGGAGLLGAGIPFADESGRCAEGGAWVADGSGARVAVDFVVRERVDLCAVCAAVVRVHDGAGLVCAENSAAGSAEAVSLRVGYPFTPVIYLLVNLFALVYSAIEKPWQALAGFGTLAVGLALFFLARNKSKAS